MEIKGGINCMSVQSSIKTNARRLLFVEIEHAELVALPENF